MINLLPSDKKTLLQAARTNVLLIRYIGISLLTIVTLLGVMYGSYSILSGTKASADELITTNDTEAGIYSETRLKVGELSGKLSATKVVLDEEVRFSKMLTSIAAQMPEGTIIGNLDLESESLMAPVSFTVFAKSTNAILSLQAAFKNSPLFSNVSFQSVSDKGGTSDYPASVTLTVVFKKGASL